MKKLSIIFLILFLLFSLTLFGCGKAKSIHIEFDENMIKENLIRQNENFRLEYFVTNDQASTFIGKIVYKFDNTCLTALQGDTKDLEVPPENKNGIIKEFQFRQYFQSQELRESCLNVPLKITIILNDKSGLLKDSFETIIRVVE